MAEQQSGVSEVSHMIHLAAALGAAGVGPPVNARIDDGLRVGWSERDILHLLVGHAVAFGWARGYWVHPSVKMPGRWSVCSRRTGVCAGLAVREADGLATEFDALTALVALALAETTEEHAGASVPRADGPTADGILTKGACWLHRVDDGRVVYGRHGTKYAHLAGLFREHMPVKAGRTIHPGDPSAMPRWLEANGQRFLTDEELEWFYGNVIREHRSRRTP